MEGTLHFRKQVAPAEVPPFKFYLMRHFPDYENPGQALVHDIVVSNITNARIADAWEGDAGIHFMPSLFEEVADLGPIEARNGYFFKLGITITGGKLLYRYR